MKRERLGLRAPRGRLSAGATGLASLTSRALFSLFPLFIETPGTRRSIGRNFVHDVRRLQWTGCGSRRNYFGGWGWLRVFKYFQGSGVAMKQLLHRGVVCSHSTD